MGFLNSLLKAVNSVVEHSGNGNTSSSSRVEGAYVPETPSGRSWGEKMPAEPNQFNYPGNYTQYFESIFAQKLGNYRMEKENGKWNNTIYTFYRDNSKALVVELLPETSSTVKVRSDCAQKHIPYLRFYYNHHGWWNTRSYVEERIAAALK